jgi:hypothetical protein
VEANPLTFVIKRGSSVFCSGGVVCSRGVFKIFRGKTCYILCLLFLLTLNYGRLCFGWDVYAVCIWFYGFITEMPKGEFVSYFI